jgi:restriction endonuclease S subunit
MIAPMKHAAVFINGCAFKPEDWGSEGLPIVRIAQLTGGEFDNFFNGLVNPRHRINDGDLLFAWSATLDSFVWQRGPAYLNQHTFKVMPKSGNDRQFLYYSLKHYAPLWADVDAHGSTTRHIKRESLSNKVWLPEISTQRAIAAFLDRETARIDQLIEKKERQITLLDQRARQAVTEIVVGKSDPSVPTMETGLEHMPQLPAHWLLRRAGLLFQQMAEPNDDDQPVLSVSIHTGISDRQLDDEERDRKVTLIEDRSSYKRVRPGYLAYNMMRAWQGGIGVSTVDGAVSPAYVVAKPTSNLHSPYYQFLLRTPAFIEQMRMGSKGIADFRLRLYWEQFRLIMLPVPPLEEQRRIATEAERELSHAAAVAAKVASSVERLKERRAALITAAVTGQIDFRSKLPTTTTKPDPAKFRVVVGAEIIHRHQGNPKFGHVKLQKLMYLAEAHAGISELQGNYLREAAGPYDRALIEGLDRSLEAAAFYLAMKPEKIEEAVTYTPLAKAGHHNADLKTLLGTRTEGLKNLISLLSDFDKRSVEAIATLYAVWNDTIMDGETPDDAAIINGVLTEWHSEKGEKFKEADLRHWLDWMKRNRLTPRGEGPKTTTGRLFV